MADEANALPSVFEFSQDISTQDAPPPLPKGKYLATISSAEAKVSATSGNTYADITFTIAPDQFPADYSAIQADAVNIHHRTMVLSKDDARSRYNIRKFYESVRAVASRKIDLNDLLGKSAMLTIDHRSYQGVDQPEIKGVEPA
jgi:hypothetical protein